MKLTLQTVTSHCRRVCVVRHDHGMTTPAARAALAPVWRLAAARGPAPQAEISGGALDSAPFWHGGAARRQRDCGFTRIIIAEAGAILPPSPRQQQSRAAHPACAALSARAAPHRSKGGGGVGLRTNRNCQGGGGGRAPRTTRGSRLARTWQLGCTSVPFAGTRSPRLPPCSPRLLRPPGLRFNIYI